MQRERGISYATPQESFKDWIAQEFQRRLDEFPHQGMDDDVTEIKVAKITMAFNNPEIINLLRARGTAIKAEQWDQQAEIEKQINDVKHEKLNMLTTPCSVFITFENEEGITPALKYDELVESIPELEKYQTWLGDKKIEIQPASEPSDIIWENRNWREEIQDEKIASSSIQREKSASRPEWNNSLFLLQL